MPHWTHEQRYFLMLWRRIPTAPMLPPVHGRMMSLSDLFESLLEYLAWDHRHAQSNQSDIIKEIQEYLKLTKLLSADNFKHDYEDLLNAFTLDLQEPANRLSLSLILTSLQSKISAFPIWKLYGNACRSVFAASPVAYHQIDSLVTAWICELGSQGYSMRFIREWARAIRLGSISFDEFVSQIERELDGQKKTYTSYVRFEIPSSSPIAESYQRTLSVIDPLAWTGPDKYKPYFAEPGKFAKISVQACDEYAALHQSVRRVMEYSRDLSLVNPDPGYRLDPTASSVVLEQPGGDTRCIEKEALRVLKLDNVRKLMEISNKEEFNRETYGRITQVLSWATHHSATNPEAQLAQTWTALESLFSPAKLQGSASEQIGRYISYFMSLSYMSTYTHSLGGILQQSKSILQEQLGNIQDVAASLDLTESLKMNRRELAQFLTEHGDTLIQAAQKNDILKRVLSDYLNCMKTDRSLYRRLDKLSEMVRRDIAQIYRHRNKFVHQGHIGSPTVRSAMERLQYYIKATLETMIYAFSINPKLEVSQLLTAMERRHEYHMNWLKSSLPGSDVDRTIQPVWLYI